MELSAVRDGDLIRFFAAPSDISDGVILLSAGDAEHIRALRLRPSELFTVCDGGGSDYICRLGERAGGSVAEIVEARASAGEPNIACSVYIALAKGDRLEYAVQKSVELGAFEIVLFPSERCVSVPGDISKKTARLRRISLETAKQCGRGRVPEVTAAGSFGSAVLKAAAADLPLFFYECEENRRLKDVLDVKQGDGPCFTVSIVTGPEGGFEPCEAEHAQSAGMLNVSLGPRILRCETAPAAALAAIMFHTGNL